MQKITNSIRVTKCGKLRMNQLLDSPQVDRYHKTMIKAIQSQMPKNVHTADVEIFNIISSENYKFIPMPKGC